MHELNSTAPVTAEEAVRLFLNLPRIREASAVILAVSGGPDSTAMLGLYAEAAQLAPLPPAIVATVDHQLRAGSDAEAHGVAAFAATLRVPHHTLNWVGAKPRTGVQAAARDERYRLLCDAARTHAAEAILAAHTLDDQAETVMMRLLKGSGLHGLGGMETTSLVRRTLLHRPMLGLPKSRLVATCDARNWPYVIDPSNENADFLRVRLRRLTPVLAREGLSVARLSRLAERMRRADEALETEALRVMESCRIWNRGATIYDAERLAAQSPEIVIRIFQHVISRTNGRDTPTKLPRLERIEALAMDFQRAVQDQLKFRRNAGGMLFTLRHGELTLRAEPKRRAKILTKPTDIP